MSNNRPELITILLSGFPVQAGTDPEAQILVYCRAVQSFSVEALSRAVDRFLIGEVPGFDARFAPSCAQLAQECRTRQEMMELQERLANTPRLPKPEEPVFTDEHRTMMLGRLGELSKAMGNPEAMAALKRKYKVRDWGTIQ